MARLVLLLALLSGVPAFAGIVSRAAFLRAVIGVGITTSDNVAAISRFSTGNYAVQLISGCPQTLGAAFTSVSRGGVSCFGDFAAPDQITVECRDGNNAFTDLPDGTILNLDAYCATP